MKRTRYKLNPETLLIEIKEASLRQKAFKVFVLIALSIALALFYVWIFSSVLGYDLPKTALLKSERLRLENKMEVLRARIDMNEDILDILKVRDEGIYRSLFGMDPIADSLWKYSGPGDKFYDLGDAGALNAFSKGQMPLFTGARSRAVPSGIFQR